MDTNFGRLELYDEEPGKYLVNQQWSQNMNNLRVIRLTIISLYSLFSLGLSGCTTVMTVAGQAAWEDRVTEDQVTDTKIHTALTKRLVECR